MPAGAKYELPLLWCRLYIGIGVCSAALGIFVLYLARGLKLPFLQGPGPIGVILIVFGPVRIANSLRVMAQIRKAVAAVASPAVKH